MTVYDDELGSLCVGRTLSSSDIAGRILQVVPAGRSFPVGPIGPAGPDGPVIAGGPAGPIGTMSPSYSDGPIDPCAAGGPVGPDGTLSPFIPNHADPAGRHVAIGPVGPFEMLSPSDCHPAGPAGPYVAGGPVGPDGTLSPLSLIMLARLAGMLLLGLFGTLSRLTVTLLAWLARMLQGDLLAQMGRCLHLSLTMLARLAGMLFLAMWARLGCCPHLTISLLARLARMLQGGPVGPDGTLSPCISDHAGPAGRHVAVGHLAPSGTVSPLTTLSVILVDPGGSTLLPGEGGPKFCPDVLKDDLVLGAAVSLPLVRDARVASSAGEVLVGNYDVITTGNIVAGHDGWSAPEMVGSSSWVVKAGCAALPRCTDTTLVCVDDQFETFNGMPVYYGGDLYDSEDSDDPYAITSAAYVEDYNFDVPEGMDLMVHDRRRSPYGSDIREDRQTGLTHVRQTSLCDTGDEFDTVDVDSLTEAFAEDVPDTDDFYQRSISLDEEDFGDPDDGSVA